VKLPLLASSQELLASEDSLEWERHPGLRNPERERESTPETTLEFWVSSG